MSEAGSLSPENERRVQEKMVQIKVCNGDYHCLDEQLLWKRLQWLEENFSKVTLTGSLVNQARELVLFHYMHLDPVDDVPLIHRSPARVTWRSYNFCPILEACQRLGLDTRVVCKQGAEKSVQTMVSRVSPNLVFSRNYENGLRPYQDYCEETIELKLP